MMPDNDDQHIARTLAEAAGWRLSTGHHNPIWQGVWLVDDTGDYCGFNPIGILQDAWHAAETICRERGWQWTTETPSGEEGFTYVTVSDRMHDEWQCGVMDESPARALSEALLAALEEEQDDA